MMTMMMRRTRTGRKITFKLGEETTAARLGVAQEDA